MSPPISIRTSVAADLPELKELVGALHESVRPFDVDLEPVERIIETYFKRLLDRVNETQGLIFVADTGTCLAGYVVVFGQVTPADVDEKPDRYSFMAELYVRPEFRKTGIGQRLVDAAESFARTIHAYKMELYVYAQNVDAIAFYEGCGFSPRVVVMTRRL